MAQLQRLSVIYDHWYDTLGPSPTAVYATLNALLRACPPSLRHLSLSTGARVTRRKAGEAIDEADQEFRLKALKYCLPSLTDLLSDAASLESLQVNGFWLADADSLAGLASLRSLSLVACAAQACFRLSSARRVRRSCCARSTSSRAWSRWAKTKRVTTWQRS